MSPDWCLLPSGPGQSYRLRSEKNYFARMSAEREYEKDGWGSRLISWLHKSCVSLLPPTPGVRSSKNFISYENIYKAEKNWRPENISVFRIKLQSPKGGRYAIFVAQFSIHPLSAVKHFYKFVGFISLASPKWHSSMFPLDTESPIHSFSHFNRKW